MSGMSEKTEKTTLASRAGHNFLTGLFLFLPVSLTLYIVSVLLDLIGKPVQAVAKEVIRVVYESSGRAMPDLSAGSLSVLLMVVSALVMILLLTLVGWLSKRLFGRLLERWFTRLLERIPGLGSLYTSIRQMVDALSGRNKDTFRRVVMVEFPRPGSWTFGFVTHEQPTVFSEALGRPVVNVFIPAAPAPTTGVILAVPPEDVRETKLTVAEALGLLMSFGAVVPKQEEKS
jgi:uncharacterized membrane protein